QRGPGQRLRHPGPPGGHSCHPCVPAPRAHAENRGRRHPRRPLRADSPRQVDACEPPSDLARPADLPCESPQVPGMWSAGALSVARQDPAGGRRGGGRTQEKGTKGLTEIGPAPNMTCCRFQGGVMPTVMPKEESIDRKWFLVDAEGRVLGRLATQVATILRGKHKPTFAPHLDVGDHVVVINAEKVQLTGRKMTEKTYRWHTGYIGGLRELSADKMIRTHPERVIE